MSVLTSRDGTTAPGGTLKCKDAQWIEIQEDDPDEPQVATWVKQTAALPGWIP